MSAAMPARPQAEGASKPILAAVIAGLFVFLVVAMAVFLSAPTRFIKILPLGQYIQAVMETSGLFAIIGLALGAILGVVTARLTYQVWPHRREREEFLIGYLFLAPYLIITLVFTLGVLLFALYISFYEYDIFTEPVFVGLENYIEAFTTKGFMQSLNNVVWYALIVTPLQTIGALLLAVFLNQRIRGKRFFRTLYYTPSVTSSVVISLIFMWLYLKTGYINYFFDTVLGWFGLHWQAVEWLNDPRGLLGLLAGIVGIEIPLGKWVLQGPSITWMAIMFQNIYTTIPTFMLMFLAALQDVPPSLYEAAEIDGANTRQQLFKITIPMMRPMILLVVVLGTIGTMQIFDQVNIMTGGGPLGTSLTPVFMVYTEAMGTMGPIQMGYASAMAFILFAIIFAFTLIQRRYIESGTEQY